MAFNHVVLEGNLATKPVLGEPDTFEFSLYHHGSAGNAFGLFLVETWAGIPCPAFFRASEGDPVVVSGLLINGYVPAEEEGGRSRSVVKIRALSVRRLEDPRRKPPAAFDENLVHFDDGPPF